MAAAPVARLGVLGSVLFVLVLVYLGVPGQVVSGVAYAVEKGRIEAAQEELARVDDVSRAFRMVAEVARPGVASISVGPGPEAMARLRELGEQIRSTRDRIATINETLRSEADALDGKQTQKLIEELLDLQSKLPDLMAQQEEHFRHAHAGAGSGVVWDERGHILTNNHVVEAAGTIRVQLHDQRTFEATLVGTDPKSDLAVVKINADQLHPLRFGDSTRMEVGDWVVAVGAPFGLSQTVTHGIISAKGRHDIDTERGILYQDFLQTDAPVNPGNSGGPLLNLRGEVIGINTAIATEDGRSSGVAFTIPSAMAVRVARELIEHGRVVRGWLGVSLNELDEDEARLFGAEAGGAVMVNILYVDSPAAKAGLQCEDIIRSVNGDRVQGLRRLQAMIADLPPDKPVRFELLRDGAPLALEVLLERQPENIDAYVRGRETQVMRRLEGLEFAARALIQGIPFRFSPRFLGKRGILVRPASQPDAPPDAIELLVGVNGQSVATISELRSAIDRARKAEPVRLELLDAAGAKRVVEVKQVN